MMALSCCPAVAVGRAEGFVCTGRSVGNAQVPLAVVERRGSAGGSSGTLSGPVRGDEEATVMTRYGGVYLRDAIWCSDSRTTVPSRGGMS